MNADDKARLSRLLKARARGPFISGAEMDRRIDAMIERKRKELLTQPRAPQTR